MLKSLLTALLAVGLSSTLAFAQDTAEEGTTGAAAGTTGTTIEDLSVDNPPDQTLDKEITNKRMRAESGSTSRWSMSIEGVYNGGSVQDPFGESRPDYRRGLEETAVGAAADIKGRFRLSPNTSVALGTGVSVIQPFHGGLESLDALDDATSVSSPYLTLSRFYAAAGLQMSSSASYSYYTAESSTIAGYEWALSFSQNVQRAFLDNRLTLGVSVSGSYYSADRSEGQMNEYNQYRARRGLNELSRDNYLASLSEYALGVYPYAEYTINDLLAFRTVFGYFNYEMASNQTSFDQSEPYQSVGIAISPARNMYFYPNVQFTPEELTLERTNVAVSAIINLF